MLKAHIKRLRVKHRWGLPLKVLNTINLFKLKKGFLFFQSFPSRSATCISKAGLGTKFVGNPSQSYQGEVMKESYPTWGGGPLGAPQLTCEEIQQALEGNSPGGGPLAGQGPRPPSRTFTYSFVGRIWHNETASKILMNSNLESSPSPAMATKELRRVNGGLASWDMTMPELNLEPQNLSAKEPGEVGEFKEAPAWGVTLESCVLANNQGLRGKLRSSGSSGKSDSPLQCTKLRQRTGRFPSKGQGFIIPGRSAMDSTSAEAQVVVRAVGRIVEEKMLPYQGLRVLEVGWCKKDLQASADPDVCYHRVLSYQEQRRVMRETASPQGTPRGHNYTNKTEWIGWPFPTRVPECPSRPCQNEVPGAGSFRPYPAGPLTQAVHLANQCVLLMPFPAGQLSSKKKHKRCR
ncbi:uncharacterized protein LOC131830141 [Mustela lutreola]|uniref:uncharacterized protein LOC131830141 n=1 Tax=Mustela lutreola TaxID=9666 RepID=UPI002796E711|nr:uncharacterized protein LOC131830141 [Mustela lutreola]